MHVSAIIHILPGYRGTYIWGVCTFGALQPIANFRKTWTGTYFRRGTYLRGFTIFPNIHSLEGNLQFFDLGIILFTKFQRRQPSRFCLAGKRLKSSLALTVFVLNQLLCLRLRSKRTCLKLQLGLFLYKNKYCRQDRAASAQAYVGLISAEHAGAHTKPQAYYHMPSWLKLAEQVRTPYHAGLLKKKHL